MCGISSCLNDANFFSYWLRFGEVIVTFFIMNHSIVAVRSHKSLVPVNSLCGDVKRQDMRHLAFITGCKN